MHYSGRPPLLLLLLWWWWYFFFACCSPTPAVVATDTDASSSDHDDDDVVFMWSSTGGGWRSMAACFGYAYAMKKANLFTNESSKFRSIATNSGASWFNTQLFYSQEFYNQVVLAPTPQDLYDFTIVWMDSYKQLAFDALQNPLLQLSYANATLPPISNINSIIGKEPKRYYSIDDEIGRNMSDLEAPAPDDDSDEEDNNSSSASSSKNENEHNPIKWFVEVYDLYRSSNASWGYFMKDMMTRATKAYGHGNGDENDNSDFADIIANAQNRIPQLQHTEMILKTTLSPSSKIRLASANFSYKHETVSSYGDTDLDDDWSFLAPFFGDPTIQDLETFLGPLRQQQQHQHRSEEEEEEKKDNATTTSTTTTTIDDDSDVHVYSVGLSAYYLVNATYGGFLYATGDSDSTTSLSTYAAPTSQFFDWKGFEGWYLYPNTGFWGQPTDPPLSIMNATIPAKYNKMSANMTRVGTLRQPFGGGPANVTQASSVSSAAAGPISPASPVIFAQVLSNIRQQIIQNLDDLAAALVSLTAFDLTTQQFYKHVLADNGAICSQWPNEPCGPNDGYFVDGAFSDNPSVTSNIAQYQNSADANLTKTIKLVLTNTNQNFSANSYDSQQVLQYFATDFNRNVPPGGYVWLPGFVTPYRSPQIFEEYLSDDDMVNAFESMEDNGSNMTTAIYKGTTIANKAFGIQAGQKVEIMFINTNSGPITTFLVRYQLIDALTIPIAEMTTNIATNEILIERLQEFFFGGGGGDDNNILEEEQEEAPVDNSEKEEAPVLNNNPPTLESSSSASAPSPPRQKSDWAIITTVTSATFAMLMFN